MSKESRARTISRDAVTAAVVYLCALGTLFFVSIALAEPRDAWGNPYRYELIDGSPVITSFGSDGQPGGEGDAADISNLRKELSSR